MSHISTTRTRCLRSALLAATLVTAACSVTTPRGEQISAGARSGDGAVTAPADETGQSAGTPEFGADLPADGTATTRASDATATTLATLRGSGPAATTSKSKSSPTSGPAGTAGDGGRQPGNSTAGIPPGGPPAAPRPAPAGPPEVGVTADTITISAIAGFGGQFGALEEGWYDGFLTWQSDVNARGGIFGRNVVLKKLDHKETVDGGIGACKQALSNGSFTAFSLIGIDANTAATQCLDDAGVPNLYYSNISQISSKWKRSYSTIVPFDQQGKSLASFVKNHLNAGAKKLGVIYLKEPSFRIAAEAYIAAAKALGMDVARSEVIEANQASFVSEVRRMQQAGVENLAMIVTGEALSILRDAKTLGWTPQFTGFQFPIDSFTRAARDLFTGVTALRWSAASDVPRYAEFKAKSDRYGHTGNVSSQDDFAFQWYGQGLALERILTAAGPAPTRQSLVAGLQSITNFDTGVLAPLSWGPGKLIGTLASFPVVCCTSGWTWKTLGPPRVDY